MSNCLKCESVWAFQERNFPVKFPDLHIVVDLAEPRSLHAADDVTIIVDVICVVKRHASSLRELFFNIGIWMSQSDSRPDSTANAAVRLPDVSVYRPIGKLPRLRWRSPIACKRRRGLVTHRKRVKVHNCTVLLWNRWQNAAMEPEVDRSNWKIGQRVARKDGVELGVVVNVDRRRVVKVKWERGRTSYYRPDVPANVKLAEPPASDPIGRPAAG
jgi:hypothetical protein